MTNLTMSMFLTKDDLEKARVEQLLDPIQNNCKYGYVLPDRCRYMRHKGCACGAYPADRGNYESRHPTDEQDHPTTCRCEECRFWGA